MLDDKYVKRPNDDNKPLSQEKSGLRNIARVTSLSSSVSPSIEMCGVNMNKSQTTSLKTVLQNSESLSAFRRFLTSEYSDENLDFWCQCEKYKKEKPNKRHRKAKKIFDTFVKHDAPREINIDANAKAQIRRNLEKSSPETFNVAQDLVYTLMQTDSFPRFLSSYQTGVNKTAGSYRRRSSIASTKSFSTISGGFSLRQTLFVRKSSL